MDSDSSTTPAPGVDPTIDIVLESTGAQGPDPNDLAATDIVSENLTQHDTLPVVVPPDGDVLPAPTTTFDVHSNLENSNFESGSELGLTVPTSLEYQDIVQSATRALNLEKTLPKWNLPKTAYELQASEAALLSESKASSANVVDPGHVYVPPEPTMLSEAPEKENFEDTVKDKTDAIREIAVLNGPDQLERSTKTDHQEDTELQFKGSGDELVRLHSSEIFGKVESEPRYSVDINNELTTLFKARGIAYSRPGSFGGLGIGNPPPTQLSLKSSGLLKFSSSSTNSITPESVTSTTFQSASWCNDIPFSTLLELNGGGDRDQKEKILDLASEAIASNGSFTRQYSSPNIRATVSQCLQISQIQEAKPIKSSSETLSYFTESGDQVLDLTIEMLEKTVAHLDLVTKRCTELVIRNQNNDNLIEDGSMVEPVVQLNEAHANMQCELTIDTTLENETKYSTIRDFYIKKKQQSQSHSRSHPHHRRSRSCCGEENAVVTPSGCSRPAAGCEASKKPAYRSGSVPRYCDILRKGGVEGNPEMVGDIIKDLQCVFEKTFGNSKNMESKYQTLVCQLEYLKQKLCEVVSCRVELEKEICRLQRELQTAQFAFNDTARGKMCLEKIVGQLRARLAKLETLTALDAKEKMQLATCLKEMEAKIMQLTEIIECLEHERDELLKNCRGFDEWKKKHSSTSNSSNNRIAQLEEALAKCCNANEKMQEELRRLKEERACLIALIDKLKCEIKRMIEAFARERECWAKERCRLEQLICDMKKAIDCLTEQNKQICRKMTEVVSAHHVEMDCLKKEADKYKALYECEKQQREKLEKALRDCEERKKEMLQQMQQQYKAMMQQQQQQPQQKPCSPQLNPCSDILNQLNSERGEYTQDLKTRLGNATTKIECLEKDLQYTQARNQEKDSLLDKNTREMEQYKSAQKSLEMQLQQTREEATQTRTMCEALQATNVELKAQLDASRNEKWKSQEAEQEQVTALRNENRQLLQTIEDERAAKELFRRECKDAQRLWETEVKAKGILADRIARTERMRTNNNNNDEDTSGGVGTKIYEEIRILKTELNMERDQVAKLKTKIEQQRVQLRSARDTLQEVSNDPKSSKLIIELDQLKHQHHNFVTSVERDREASRIKISELEHAKFELERELQKLREELRNNQLNRDVIQEIMRRKDIMEKEVERLKTVLNENYVERSRVDQWKAAYEQRISSVRNQCDASVEAQVKAKLLEMQLALERQVRDRAIIDKMRDSNEDAVRQEQTNLAANLKAEIDQLKQIVRARDEEISSLKSSILHLKKKYSSEANMKDELLKKLQAMSAASRTSLPSISNNNI